MLWKEFPYELKSGLPPYPGSLNRSIGLSTSWRLKCVRDESVCENDATLCNFSLFCPKIEPSCFGGTFRISFLLSRLLSSLCGYLSTWFWWYHSVYWEYKTGHSASYLRRKIGWALRRPQVYHPIPFWFLIFINSSAASALTMAWVGDGLWCREGNGLLETFFDTSLI